MPEGKNDGVLSLNVKMLLSFALSQENKPDISVREFISIFNFPLCD